MTYVVGLDISKGKSYAVLYQKDQCLWEKEIPHNQLGFRELLDQIAPLPERPEVVFEATGIYSKPVETLCQDNGLPFCRLNPQEANKQMQVGTLRSWKTDQSDAHRLALTHGVYQREQVTSQANTYVEMRDWTRFYQEIDTQITKIQNHLYNALHLTFPELEALFSNRISPYALTLIQLYPHPDVVLNSSPTKIKNRLKKATRKNISENKAWTKAEEIVDYAQLSYPSVASDSVQCQKVRYYASTLHDLIDQKEVIKQAMIDQAQAFPEWEIYQSFPGVGESTAAQIIGELGDVTRFSNHKKLNAFVGIDIRRYQSGKIFSQDRINKRGNKQARKLLFLVILNMIRSQKSGPNHIVNYYYKLKTAPYAKKHKVAVIACMNKFLKCLHAMVHKKTLYDYSYTAS